MLKNLWEKAKKARCRLLLVSSIFVILSIPLTLISTKIMAFAMTFWFVVVFFKLFEEMKTSGVTVKDFDKQGEKALEEGKILKGFINFLGLRLAFALGIPTIAIGLLIMWLC